MKQIYIWKITCNQGKRISFLIKKKHFLRLIYGTLSNGVVPLEGSREINKKQKPKEIESPQCQIHDRKHFLCNQPKPYIFLS